MFSKKIGITQKLIKHPNYEETLAGLELNWFSLLTAIGAKPIPLALVGAEGIEGMLDDLNLNGLIFKWRMAVLPP